MTDYAALFREEPPIRVMFPGAETVPPIIEIPAEEIPGFMPDWDELEKQYPNIRNCGVLVIPQGGGYVSEPRPPIRLQTEFAAMRPEDRELYEPDPDDLTRAELAEYAHLPWSDVAATLDDWLTCRQNERPGTNGHHVGTFLDLLAARGYRVTPIPESSLDTLLGAPTE